jgi:hypothetical protein
MFQNIIQGLAEVFFKKLFKFFKECTLLIHESLLLGILIDADPLRFVK